MKSHKKLAAVTAALAVAVPVGLAQATHESGKLGAPGQVCKTVHPNSTQAKQALQTFKQQTPAPTKAQVQAFRKTQREAYKGCIQGAAKARSADQPQEGEGGGS